MKKITDYKETLLINKIYGIYAIKYSKGWCLVSASSDNNVVKLKLLEKNGTILDDDFYFSSVIPAVKTKDIIITVNQRNVDAPSYYVRGVIKVNPNNLTFEYTTALSDTYSFIDGFDGGLARVNKKVGEQNKKWGIIDIYGELVNSSHKLEFDNIWSFYNKKLTFVRAEKDGESIEINLSELRGGMHKTSYQHETKIYIPTLNRISFANYKKYPVFPDFDISGGINYIVGKNNAGKSTFLQALKIVLYNIRNLKYTQDGKLLFNFNCANFKLKDDFNYGQLYCRNSNSEDCLHFSAVLGNCSYTFYVKYPNEIYQIEISHLIYNINIIIDSKNNVSLFFNGCKYKGHVLHSCEFHDKKNSPLIRDRKNAYKLGGKNVNHDFGTNQIYENLHPFDILLSKRLAKIHDFPLPIDVEDNMILLELEEANRRKLFPVMKVIEEAINDVFNNAMYSVESAYVPLFLPVTKKTTFTNDPNDFISETIWMYYNVDSNMHKFMQKWLKIMEIGDDFILNRMADLRNSNEEVIKCEIIDSNGKSKQLYELGSGSIHFLILAFRIISIAFNKKYGHFCPIIEVEEPEQNLHPMLQSNLANFFLDLTGEYKKMFKEEGEVVKGLKIMIETHSEYMIRKSQILVKKLYRAGFSKEEIPFKTFYFPSAPNTIPWDMIYMENGHFENKFDSGFTDESSLLAMQIL